MASDAEAIDQYSGNYTEDSILWINEFQMITRISGFSEKEQGGLLIIKNKGLLEHGSSNNAGKTVEYHIGRIDKGIFQSGQIGSYISQFPRKK